MSRARQRKKGEGVESSRGREGRDDAVSWLVWCCGVVVLLLLLLLYIEPLTLTLLPPAVLIHSTPESTHINRTQLPYLRCTLMQCES